MRYRSVVLERMQEKIVQMGLSQCPVCSSGSLHVARRPTLETIGGFHHPKPDPRNDPEANVMFLVHVECSACGYVLLFNSESLESSEGKQLIVGMTIEEEEAAEASGRWDD